MPFTWRALRLFFVGSAFAFGVTNSVATSNAQTPPNFATSFLMNAAHTGSIQLSVPFSPPLKQAWSQSFEGPVSYPIVTQGLVFVFVAMPGSEGGSKVYALNLSNGQIVWKHFNGDGYYRTGGLAYDAGRLFVLVDKDHEVGVLKALSPSTGHVLWSKKFRPTQGFSSSPTAGNGLVLINTTGADGGLLLAYGQSDGVLKWKRILMDSAGSPAVGPDGLYFSYPEAAFKLGFDGSEIWTYATGLEGGGATADVLYGNRLYVRDTKEIHAADTGAIVDGLSTDVYPAVFGNIGIVVTNGKLFAIALDTGNVMWSFVGDGTIEEQGFPFSVPPIVVNGVVYVGALSGMLYALDGATGNQLWSVKIGTPIKQGLPVTGLGAGFGTLIVPAGDTITAFVPQ